MMKMQKRYVAEHHPFTRPNEDDVHLFDTDPGKIRAQAYDFVLNGYEVGGGSMRIYKREVQEKMFAALGFTQKKLMRSSASCWKLSNMAHLRMVVLLLVLTVWYVDCRPHEFA